MRLGHDVRVIAPASKALPDFGERFIPLGKPRSIPSSGSIARITLSLWLGRKIKEILAREQFDIIHLHEPFMPMLCSAVLRFSNTVTVGTFHAASSFPGYYIGWPVSTFMVKRRNVKLSARIAVSLAAYRYHKKFVPGEFQIIPNGVDLDVFKPSAKPLPEFADGKLNILFVGRLESRKGFNYLLHAYLRIKKEKPNSRLIVVGPGKALLRRYQNFVRTRNVEDVVFVGRVSQEALPRYYSSADIFCSPATGRESFGIVLLEAMAMGKPIIASSIEGYRCVVTNGIEGILVPPRDDRKLAAALIRLADDPELRRKMGANGLQKAQEYCWEKIAGQILDCYRKVLNMKKQEVPV